MSNQRTTATRPTTDMVLNPQAAKEAAIKAVFKAQFRHLAALFPKDGDTLVNRACAAAVSASRERDPKGNVKLANIEPEIIAATVIAAHHMGLEIGDEAYLVPYGATLQLITGPRGLIKLMYRSGFVSAAEARAVREGDAFEYDLGDTGYIKHRKAVNNRDGAVTHAYFFAKTTTGGTVREVLTVDDIEFYRSKSKQANGPAWTDNYEGMCRKTAIHRGVEFVPRNALLSAALHSNEAGGVEIPDEFFEAARASANKPAPAVEQMPAAPAREMSEEP